MTRTQPGHSWLGQLFRRAAERRWCTRLGCTTCGALEFRNAYLAEALRRAGVAAAFDEVEPLRTRHPRQLLARLSAADRRTVFFVIVNALATLDEAAVQSDAFWVVCGDLEPPLLRWGIVDTLAERLIGTPAADAIAARRSWEAARAAVDRWGCGPAAVRTIAGSARSMGLNVEGV